MTLELGGQITIACEKTGYSAQLEFRLKVLVDAVIVRVPGCVVCGSGLAVIDFGEPRGQKRERFSSLVKAVMEV